MFARRLTPGLAALALFSPLSALAAPAIHSFDTAESISADSSVQVQETIVTDPLGPHGIYRDIPLSFTAVNGTKQEITVKDVSVVDQNGAPYETLITRQGGNEHIRIGSPSVTVSGVKTYVITYTLRGALTPYDTFDELYWNATGDGWSVPIEHASAKVITPTTVSVSEVRATCYVGARGSKASCPPTINGNDNGRTSVVFSAGPLNPGQGLTIAVGFPKGLVTYPPPVPWWREWLLTLIALALLVGAIIFAIVFAMQDQKGRGTIIPIYEPPQNLRPAEADVLVHGRVGKRAWPATVVDFAVRGYVTIAEDTPLPWWRLSWSKDYVVTRTEGGTQMEDYERRFLETLFAEGDTFSTRELRQNQARGRALHFTMMAIESDLRKETASDTGAYLLDPETAKRRAIGAFILAAFGVIIAFVLSGHLEAYRDPLIAVGLLAVAAFAAAYPVYLRPRLNREGAVEREQWLGFKLYLETAEKYRLQNLTPETFQKFLPYAMVFGIEKKWARAFEGIAMPPPSWYSGSAANAAAFSASGFTNSFSSSFASSFAASGAGGASGGGGGAGGGGGGGW